MRCENVPFLPGFRLLSGFLAAAMCVAVGAAARGAEGDQPAAKGNQIVFSAEVDLGQDRGQSLGSLFEVRDASGRLQAGAGFQDVYNTRFRTGRRTLQFFIRPDSGKDQLTLERLPHPDQGTGVYLTEFDGQLYSWSYAGNNSVRRWDAASEKWLAELPPGMQSMRSGDGTMRLGSGQLVFAENQASYNGKQILAPPESGRYYNFYYAEGHLFFYHEQQQGEEYLTRILACPWTTDSKAAIDLDDATILTTKFPRETPFAWGQYGRQVLTVSNMGGMYVFENDAWKTVVEGLINTSYQVYSMLHWYDRVLLAQYPTGNLFEYQGKEPVQLQGWPPVLPGVSTAARESQTMALYRGELLVGVWPWAEMWRYERQSTSWRSLGRAFTHPELTDKQVHPYEQHTERYRLVRNHWGQRVTSLVPQGDSLYVATSSKGTSDWEDRYDFLTEAERREYGAVLRLKLPGNLAAGIEWKDGPTRFDFRLTHNLPDIHQMEILQDGRVLGSTTLPKRYQVDLSSSKITWKAGIYGPFQGELGEHLVK